VGIFCDAETKSFNRHSHFFFIGEVAGGPGVLSPVIRAGVLGVWICGIPDEVNQDLHVFLLSARCAASNLERCSGISVANW
jgi:hypothetical protein